MTYQVKPLDKVYVSAGSGTRRRYHRGAPHGVWPSGYSACGIIRIEDAAEMTEVGAIASEYLPCGRCWFRTWRNRVQVIRAQLTQKGAIG